MSSSHTLGQLLRSSLPDSSDAVVAIPRQAKLSLETPVLLVSELDENDDPVLPNGYCELMPLWRISEIFSGLSQLLSAQLQRPANHSEVVARFVQYLERDA